MIICCGEALIDMLPFQLDDGSNTYLPVPGGAVFNTAIALGRLGQQTAFISGISNDLFGRQLIAALEQSSVTTGFVHRSDHPTTLAFVELTDGQAQYTFYDEKSATRELNIADLPTLDGSVQAMQFGAISLINEPGGSAYEHLMSSYSDRTVIALDPNIRPLFIHDSDAHRDRLNRMIAMSDIVKVSDEDLAWLAPGETWQAFGERWLAAGVPLLIRTLGEHGAEARTEKLSINIPAVATTVVDTIGAGDAFNAGVLAALQSENQLSKRAIRQLDEQALNKVLTFASEVSAITVSRAGANPPWDSELNQTK